MDIAAVESQVDRTFNVNTLGAFVANKQPVAFSRWGDGEWTCILQKRKGKANCDGHRYFPDMAVDLADVLRERPPYFTGLQRFALRVCEGTIPKWLTANGLEDKRWVESDIFHKAAQNGIWDFKEWPTLLVGPAHLRSAFKNIRFVEIPSRNCWLETQAVLQKIRTELTDNPAHVVGFCASMPSKVWIHWLWKEDGNRTLIDFGSVFDPLVGVKSRRYMRK